MPNIVEILIKATNESGKAFAEAEATGNSMANSVQKAGNIAAVALVATGVAAVKMASDYESAVTRLETSAGESKSNIDMVSKGMLDMAGQVGTSAEELAKGMYTVESAGYHGADGLKVLKASAQGAKDENADLADVANGVTDVLKDYHLGADQAAKVTSQMVEAVSYGKTTFELFSKAMAQVVPIAAAAHLKIGDVTGVLAEMTSHGVSAQQAAQNISRAIQSLLNPTSVMKKEYEAFGLTVQQVQQHLSQQGLGGTMEWLSQIAEQSSSKIGQNYEQAMAKLMGNSAGLKVALMTTGENAKETATAITAIGNASADANGNVEGFSEVQKTLKFQLEQIKASFESLMIEIGQKVIPVVKEFIGFLADHKSEVATFVGVVIAFAGALAIYSMTVKVAAAATTLWAIATGELDLAAALNPIGLVVVAIAALVAGIIYLWKNNEGFRNFWKAAWEDIKQVVSAVWEFLKPIFEAIGNLGKQVIADIEQWWKEHGEQIKVIAQVTWDVIVAIIKTAWAMIKVVVDAVVPPLVDLIKGAWDVIAGSAKFVWDLLVAIIKFAFDTIMANVNVFLDLITGHWGQAWKDLTNYFKQIWDIIVTLVKDAMNAIGQALDGGVQIIETIWNTLVDILTAPFKAAWGIISSIIKSISDAANAITSFGNSFNIGFAHGGIVGGAASGGARSGLQVVGEHGIELVRMPAGSRVYSNPDTERMLAGAGGGGGTVTLVIQSDGGAYSEFLATELKKLARVRGGGNLQLAIVGRT